MVDTSQLGCASARASTQCRTCDRRIGLGPRPHGWACGRHRRHPTERRTRRHFSRGSGGTEPRTLARTRSNTGAPPAAVRMVRSRCVLCGCAARHTRGRHETADSALGAVGFAYCTSLFRRGGARVGRGRAESSCGVWSLVSAFATREIERLASRRSYRLSSHLASRHIAIRPHNHTHTHTQDTAV